MDNAHLSMSMEESLKILKRAVAFFPKTIMLERVSKVHIINLKEATRSEKSHIPFLFQT
jgi:hypothetical protein